MYNINMLLITIHKHVAILLSNLARNCFKLQHNEVALVYQLLIENTNVASLIIMVQNMRLAKENITLFYIITYNKSAT